MSFPVTVNNDFYSVLSARQEQFSGAHIRAICASLGCGVSKPEPDDDKLDFTVSSKVVGKKHSKPKLDVQSKCYLSTSPLPFALKEFSYEVDKSLYDNLRDPNVISPRILVVTLVPKDAACWITYSHENTLLSYSSYWYSLKGMPALPAGQKSKSLRIPKENTFTAEFLNSVMLKIADGTDPFS